MPRATKKHLGRKKPSKTRKNRKPLKKNKRRNIKKGGFFNTPFTTFDYSQRVSLKQVVYVVETLSNAKDIKKKPIIFSEVPYDSRNPYDINLRISNGAVKNYLEEKKNILKNNPKNNLKNNISNNELPINEFKKVFNQMMKEFDKENQEPAQIWNETFKINPVKDDRERLRCVINTALNPNPNLKVDKCKTMYFGIDLKYPTSVSYTHLTLPTILLV